MLGMVQNPPKCKSVEELGGALEDWLAKKRQYEEFTDNDAGSNASADAPVFGGEPDASTR